MSNTIQIQLWKGVVGKTTGSHQSRSKGRLKKTSRTKVPPPPWSHQSTEKDRTKTLPEYATKLPRKHTPPKRRQHTNWSNGITRENKPVNYASGDSLAREQSNMNARKIGQPMKSERMKADQIPTRRIDERKEEKKSGCRRSPEPYDAKTPRQQPPCPRKPALLGPELPVTSSHANGRKKDMRKPKSHQEDSPRITLEQETDPRMPNGEDLWTSQRNPPQPDKGKHAKHQRGIPNGDKSKEKGKQPRRNDPRGDEKPWQSHDGDKKANGPRDRLLLQENWNASSARRWDVILEDDALQA
ncbi:hypothetical protein BC829DRAFT_420790 [Chytridium lagenaria]|nr:hypothetical protein BC829DRAFT_420790 [Chytridium lagenaria]